MPTYEKKKKQNKTNKKKLKGLPVTLSKTLFNPFCSFIPTILLKPFQKVALKKRKNLRFFT